MYRLRGAVLRSMRCPVLKHMVNRLSQYQTTAIPPLNFTVLDCGYIFELR